MLRGTPTRCHSALDRSSCVTLKFLYKICMYAGVLKISIKFLSYALFPLAPSIRVILSFRVPPVRSERMAPTIHPSERTVVSRSSRDQRDTRPRMTRVTLTRDVFIISYPLFVVNLHSRIYNRRFNFIKIFFLLICSVCLAYRVIKVSRKFIPLHRKKNASSPRSSSLTFACSLFFFLISLSFAR